MNSFRIRYLLNHSYLEEMKSMTLDEIEYQFSSIYGQFTIIIDDYEYLVFIDDIPEQFMPSELVDSQFLSLVQVIKSINSKMTVYMKYIENNWTWLSFRMVDNHINICELHKEYEPMMNETINNYTIIDDSFFGDALIKHGPFIIDRDRFVQEVNEKFIQFIIELKSTNEIILKSKHLRILVDYYNDILLEDGRV